MNHLETTRKQLEEYITGFRSVIVGFSAGVDSSVVAMAARSAFGKNALVVTANTETITSEDLLLARSIADEFDLHFEEITYSELEIDHYAENPANRCFYCKDALYKRLAELAYKRNIAVLLDGTNADDKDDYRPGRQAALEHGVRSPLLELGIGKDTVRALAKLYGLPNHDKPSAPCLSSRVPYRTEITQEILRQIDDAERNLRLLGFGELRVRHHGEVARVELPRENFDRALALADEIDQAVRSAGYSYVALDLRGFRSGSLNERLTQIEFPMK
ncbi:MAG: ATP-dependent sacrificial sulfur transferase LarE [Chlorobi bacterium]|nr:ATP-dependent sacrificial sulfur transferase LarE [Chlorobiota bacterium]